MDKIKITSYELVVERFEPDSKTEPNWWEITTFLPVQRDRAITYAHWEAERTNMRYRVVNRQLVEEVIHDTG